MRRLPLLLLLASPPSLAARGASATPPPPATWTSGAAARAPTVPWWEALGQPELARLIDEALQSNFDLRAARDRVRQADALSQQALAALLPSIRFDYSFGGQNQSLASARSFTPPELFPELSYSGQGNVTAALALDLFGRNTLGYQAMRSDRAATTEDRAELSLALAQRIALAWFDAATYGAQARIVREQLAANEQVLELVQLRFARAEATAADVLQQEQQVAALRAQLPLAEAGRDVAARQLAVLTGRPPVPVEVLPADLPPQPAPPALGAPTELADHRPDLRASDLRLTSAWRRRLQAERSFLPSISGSFTLTGVYGNTFPKPDTSTEDSPVDRLLQDYGLVREPPTFPTFAEIQADPSVVDAYFAAQTGGFSRTGLFNVGSGSGYGWSVGVQISMPLFDFGQTIASLRQARAAESAAANALAQATLSAMQEVEAARLQLDAQAARVHALEAQAEAARSAWRAATEAYASGSGQYLSVLTAMVSMQAAELSLLQAHRNRLDADLLLRDALGGAWTRDLGGSR